MKVAHLTEVVLALNGANARYLIVGGLAVNAHGYSQLQIVHDEDQSCE
jgi:hypothetical protein